MYQFKYDGIEVKTEKSAEAADGTELAFSALDPHGFSNPGSVELYLKRQKDMSKYFMPMGYSTSFFAPLPPTSDFENTNNKESSSEEFALEGNLGYLCTAVHMNSDPKVLLLALNLFIQMGRLLMKLKTHQCAFSHFDLHTFYMHQNKIRIANAETLIRLEESNTPSEEQKSEQDAQAQGFGTCLYDFLSGPVAPKDAPFSFDRPIFQIAEGQTLQSLIIALRQGGMSLEKAMTQLKKINPTLLQMKLCSYSLLDTIEELSRDREGVGELIQEYRLRINAAGINTIKVVYKDLETLEMEEREGILLKVHCHNLLDKILDAQKSPTDLPPMEDSGPIENRPFSHNHHALIRKASPTVIKTLLVQLKSQHEVLFQPSLKRSELPNKCQRAVNHYVLHKVKKKEQASDSVMVHESKSTFSEARPKRSMDACIQSVAFHTPEQVNSNDTDLRFEVDFGRLFLGNDVNNAQLKKPKSSEPEAGKTEDSEMTSSNSNQGR